MLFFDMLEVLENLIQQKVWPFNLLCQICLKTFSNLDVLIIITVDYLILPKVWKISIFWKWNSYYDSKHHLRKNWRPKHSNFHLDPWLEMWSPIFTSFTLGWGMINCRYERYSNKHDQMGLLVQTSQTQDWQQQRVFCLVYCFDEDAYFQYVT